MVRPAAFTGNEVTRPSNRFQSARDGRDPALIAKTALAEFDACVATLVGQGVDVRVFPGRTSATLPDEIFPNNWFTTHADGTAILYPLMAWNRRPERRRDILDLLQKGHNGFRIDRLIDLSHLEADNHFLEGTGSLVFDHGNHLAYACLSPRTRVAALREFAARLGHDIFAFKATDRNKRAIYHTNVMMSLGERFAFICLDAVRAADDRLRIATRLERSGREVIEFGLDQLHCFAGNIIQLRAGQRRLIAMSRRAFDSLTDAQRQALARHGKLVRFDIGTIETYGGGSIRCMLAELLLPRKAAAAGLAADD